MSSEQWKFFGNKKVETALFALAFGGSAVMTVGAVSFAAADLTSRIIAAPVYAEQSAPAFPQRPHVYQTKGGPVVIVPSPKIG